MKSIRPLSFVAGALFTALLPPTLALATLCNESDIRQRHSKEAELLEKETFAQGDYKGDRSYNARVIACNRSRDSEGKEVEAEFKTDETFGSDLGERIIRGKISYFGIAPLRYGYVLSRKGGTWILTSIQQFDFPDIALGIETKVIDLPMALATQLKGGKDHCSKVKKDALGFVTAGPIRVLDKDAGGTTIPLDDPHQACRFDRGEKLLNTVTNQTLAPEGHLTEYWRAAIEKQWSRPGFKVEVILAKRDKVSADRMKQFEDAGLLAIGESEKSIVWNIHLNQNEKTRAMYKPIAGGLIRPNPIYAGTHADVLVHEFGHSVGLDDEYPEGDEPKPSRDCQKLSAKGGSYTMCHPTLGGIEPNWSKGVYPWILTRRYDLGEPIKKAECKVAADCKKGFYCDLGVLTIGKNTCRKLRSEDEPCSADKQCASSKCKGVIPFAKCDK